MLFWFTILAGVEVGPLGGEALPLIFVFHFPSGGAYQEIALVEVGCISLFPAVGLP